MEAMRPLAGKFSSESVRVHILSSTLLVCLAASFVLRPSPVWALTFYLGVLPATLHRLWRGADFPWGGRLILLVGLLILWSGLTLLWGENPGGGRVGKFAFDTVCTAIFFCAVFVSAREDSCTIRNIMTVLIVAAAANAALSIMLFLIPFLPDLPPHGARLTGWAETRHSILGALVIGVGYLAALDRVVRERRFRFLNLLACLVCLAFVVLTGSRGPFFSVLVATIVVMLGSMRQVVAAMVGIGIAGAAVVALVPQVVLSLATRPSYRMEIWKFTLGRVAERPWTGHGLAAYLGLSSKFTFPHSLYFSTLFYSGIVGLALLLTVIAWVTWGLVKITRATKQPLLLAIWVLALCGGLTDLGQVTEGPGPLWIFFWLPLALACAVLSGAAYEPRLSVSVVLRDKRYPTRI